MTQSGERLIKAAEQAKQIATADIPDDVMHAANDAYDDAMGAHMRGNDPIPFIAEAIIAERQRSQWQPIETAPKDGREVLLLVPANKDGWRKSLLVAVFKDGEWYADAIQYWQQPPERATHWMEIPEPPKGE